jgi:hypothetical protein
MHPHFDTLPGFPNFKAMLNGWQFLDVLESVDARVVQADGLCPLVDCVSTPSSTLVSPKGSTFFPGPFAVLLAFVVTPATRHSYTRCCVCK